jgi:hypothetical protein
MNFWSDVKPHFPARSFQLLLLGEICVSVFISYFLLVKNCVPAGHLMKHILADNQSPLRSVFFSDSIL